MEKFIFIQVRHQFLPLDSLCMYNVHPAYIFLSYPFKVEEVEEVEMEEEEMEEEEMEEIELSSDEEDEDNDVALIVLKRPPVTERIVEEVEVRIF